MSSKYKIIFVSPGPLSLGGISAVVENYRASSFWKNNSCRHFGSSSDKGNRYVRLVYSFWRYLYFIFTMIFFRPGIVWVHVSSGGSFYRKTIYIILSRLFFCKTVIHIHPSHFYDFYINGSQFRRFFIRFILNRGHVLSFLTEEMKEKFSSLLPNKKGYVISNPVNYSIYNETNRDDFEGNYKVLYLGWIIKAKGVYDIVECMPKVIQEFPNVEFIFAGNKEVDRLKLMIEEKGLSNNAKILGWVDRDEKIALLRSSRMLLLPSYTEGVPNVILEAMATGLPILTSPVGGIPSVFTEQVNGYYVEPKNINDISEKICQLLSDNKLCIQLSKSTVDIIRKKYDVEIIGEKLASICKQIK